MLKHPFTLRPFEERPPNSDLRLGGTVRRSADTLSIRYLLEGNLDGVVIPAPEGPPCRRDGLWESTCFECFLALPSQPAYWEFNLSPGGDWNVYRLSGYRLGLAPEMGYRQLGFAVTRRPDGLSLELECPLPPATRGVPHLDLGISAVVESRQGELSYWALHHPAPQPDFHRRESFLIRLPFPPGPPGQGHTDAPAPDR